MPDTSSPRGINAERPFAITAEKYNAEYASGKVTGSKFPHHEVRRLPGYAERNTPRSHGKRRNQGVGSPPYGIRRKGTVAGRFR